MADEIRKLADNSSSSVQQISDITENIVNFMEKIAEGISNASETAQAQAALTEGSSLHWRDNSIAAVLKEMARNWQKCKRWAAAEAALFPYPRGQAYGSVRVFEALPGQIAYCFPKNLRKRPLFLKNIDKVIEGFLYLMR